MRLYPTSALKDFLPTGEGALPDDAVFMKIDVLDAPLVDESAPRRLRFTISTSTVDRDRDVITQTGWQLDNYLRNPVVLWAHTSWDLPIARSVAMEPNGAALVATAEFAPADVYPFAETVYQLVQAGYLRATSVGFRPLEMTYDTERNGYNFLRQELLEWSIVPVPCNAQCLVDAKGQGIDLAPLKAWAERTLDTLSDEPGMWLPKARVAEVFALLEPKTISVPAPPRGPLASSLARYVRALGQTPPWEASPALWARYEDTCRALDDAGDDAALRAAADAACTALEAQFCPAPAPVPLAPVVLTLSDEPLPTAAALDVDPAALCQSIRDAVGQALLTLTGRVPLT
jgi:HK97 family phage prohead protease